MTHFDLANESPAEDPSTEENRTDEDLASMKVLVELVGEMNRHADRFTQITDAMSLDRATERNMKAVALSANLQVQSPDVTKETHVSTHAAAIIDTMSIQEIAVLYAELIHSMGGALKRLKPSDQNS